MFNIWKSKMKRDVTVGQPRLVGCSSRNAGGSHFTAELFARLQARTKILSCRPIVIRLWSRIALFPPCVLDVGFCRRPLSEPNADTAARSAFPPRQAPLAHLPSQQHFSNFLLHRLARHFPTASCCNLPSSGGLTSRHKSWSSQTFNPNPAPRFTTPSPNIA